VPRSCILSSLTSTGLVIPVGQPIGPGPPIMDEAGRIEPVRKAACDSKAESDLHSTRHHRAIEYPVRRRPLVARSDRFTEGGPRGRGGSFMAASPGPCTRATDDSEDQSGGAVGPGHGWATSIVVLAACRLTLSFRDFGKNHKKCSNFKLNPACGALGSSRSAPGRSRGLAAPRGFERLPARWENARGNSGPALDHRLSIHEDLELSGVTANHLEVDLSLAAKPGRHVGGLRPGGSMESPPSVTRTMSHRRNVKWQS
jgi:hypothetical protein